ncbi:MAG: PQQ-binding-like beta-propeller repeat protein [Rhodothermia bacterium]
MRNLYEVSSWSAGSRGWLLVQKLTVLSLPALLVSCTPLRIQFQDPQSDTDWSIEGRTIRRDRVAADIPVNLPIEQAWIYNAGAGFSSGSPLVVSDLIFVGTRKGEVHVIELATGDKVGVEEFGSSIEGVPAVVGQTLFVPNAWGKNALIAFDLFEGVRLWEHRGVPIEASVLPVRDVVIVGDVEGNVISLDRATGTIRWVYEFEQIATILSGPTAISEDRIVVVNELGDVVYLAVEDGTEVWASSLREPVQESIATDQRHVYIPTTRGSFYALDAETGEKNWEYRLPNEGIRFTGAAVSPRMAVFGGSDGVLRALDPNDGTVIWTFQTDGTFAAPPAISGELVFVGSMDRGFFALSAYDGSVQWSTTLRGRIKSAPAIRKGFVIVMSEPKYVYAFANVEAIAGL